MSQEMENVIAIGIMGKEKFVSEIYRNHGVALKFFVMRLNAGDQHSAEDITQETMLRAWTHADSLRGSDRSIRPWLFTVARRLVIDANRQRDTRPREVPYETNPPADDAETALDEGFEAAQTRDEVVRALKSLTPAQREVILYTHYLGKSVAETAHELGIPSGTVKSRTYNALRALRTHLLTESLQRRHDRPAQGRQAHAARVVDVPAPVSSGHVPDDQREPGAAAQRTEPCHLDALLEGRVARDGDDAGDLTARGGRSHRGVMRWGLRADASG
jgi:RNA polymerase sigma-70 factor, ECF subfamily